VLQRVSLVVRLRPFRRDDVHRDLLAFVSGVVATTAQRNAMPKRI